MQTVMGFHVVCETHADEVVGKQSQAVISRSDNKCVSRLDGEMTFSEQTSWQVGMSAS